MPSIITDFVRLLNHGPEEPAREVFDQLWEALRGMLAVEMKRRSVWQTPPSFLGIVGHPWWVEAGEDSDALDELTAECFEFVFVRRLESLASQAQRKSSIDGLVHLALRHFLLDAQSRHDPLGFRIFEILRDLVLSLLGKQRLFVVAGDRRVRNDTCLARVLRTSASTVRQVSLDELIERWAGPTLSDLVTASHGPLDDLRTRLGDDLLDTLEKRDLPGFRFGELVSPLKSAARQHWASHFLELPQIVSADGDGEGPRQEATQWKTLSESERFAKLVECVEGKIDRFSSDRKTDRYLRALWDYLRGFSSGAIPALHARGGDEDQLPGHRQLERLLGIPRDRFPRLFEQFREWLRDCQEAIDTKQGGASMAANPKQRAFTAAQAAAGRLARETAFEPECRRPAPGDRFLLPVSAVEGVEWLAVRHREGGGLLYCVPLDTCPLSAGRDLRLSELSDHSSPWVLRPTYGRWIPGRALDSAGITGSLSSAMTDDILRQLQAGTPAADRRPAEDLPAYRDWLAEGPERAAEEVDRLLSGPEARVSTVWPRALAAALLLAAVGLTVYVFDLRQQVTDLSTPILGLPYREVRFGPEPRGTWELSVPEGATHVQLGLVLRPLDEHEQYRVELKREDGRLLFRSPDLEPRGEYTLTLPVRTLLQGKVTIRFSGFREGEWVQLDEEEFLLQRP